MCRKSHHGIVLCDGSSKTEVKAVVDELKYGWLCTF